MIEKEKINNFKAEMYDEISRRDVYMLFDSYRSGYNFDLMIDIGTNVGMFSLPFSFLYTNSDIFAFEPVEDLFEAYKETMAHKNIDKRNNSKCHVYNLAVSEDDKDLYLNKHFKKNNLGLSTTNSEPINEDNILVKTISLKSIINRFDIDYKNLNIFLKADCEGCENYFLTNNNIELLKYFTQISFEVHGRRTRRIVDKDIYSQLESTHKLYKPKNNIRVFRKGK